MAVLKDGQRLGSYTVERLLGLGGMAEVYRATHATLERDVAIKVLNPEFNADPTFPLRFLREAKTVARLNHPNIITVYDFGEQGELAYLVMELATGGSYEDRIEQFRTLSDVVAALTPVCEALHYAHAQGVVHRDLKPDNILLNDQSRSLLADFGLARLRTESLDVTEHGMILGTPTYMAPEQALGEDVDQRADIYAMGVMTYRLVAGRNPFTGQTFFAIVQQHLKTPAPSIRDVIYDAPQVLDDAIRRAMAKRREERFDTVMGFLEELRRAAAEAPDLPVGRERLAPAGTARSFAAAAAQARGEAAVPDATAALAICSGCGLVLRQGDSFCRNCGTRRDAGSPPALPPADGGGGRTIPPAGVATGGDGGRPAGGGEPRAAASASPASGELRRRRRPSSFTPTQWALLGAGAFLVLFINIVGFWLANAGRDAAGGNVLTDVTTYIYDHLRAFKSGMTVLAVIAAGTAVGTMRAAIVENLNLPPATYRRLRRYHRLAGYSAGLIAIAIGLFTCVGIFGFGTDSPRSVIHSILGVTTLVVLVAKVIVVRYVPFHRRHLKLLGQSLLLLFVLVMLTSTVPYLYDVIAGDDGGGYYDSYGR